MASRRPVPIGTCVPLAPDGWRIEVPCEGTTHAFEWTNRTWIAQQACTAPVCTDVRRGLRNLGRSYKVTVAQTAKWVAVGVRTTAAFKLWAAGFRAEDAVPWIQAGVAPKAAGEWHRYEFTPTERSEWIARKVSRASDARGWADLGVTPETVKPWIAMRVTSADAAAYAASGFTEPDAVTEWADQVGLAPHAAAQWLGFGDPADIVRWSAAFNYPALAAQWRSAGFTPTAAGAWSHVDNHDYRKAPARAALWRERGWTPDQALALREAVMGLTPQRKRPVDHGWYLARQWSTVTASYAEARCWMDLGVLEPEAVTEWRKVGADPVMLVFNAGDGEHTVTVPCGDTTHEITVKWSNGRARFTAHGHDEQTEKIGAAFGGVPPQCVRIVRLARQLRSAATVETPDRILDRCVTANFDVDAGKHSFIRAKKGYPIEDWGLV